jgi:hypothetical protein
MGGAGRSSHAISRVNSAPAGLPEPAFGALFRLPAEIVQRANGLFTIDGVVVV